MTFVPFQLLIFDLQIYNDLILSLYNLQVSQAKILSRNQKKFKKKIARRTTGVKRCKSITKFWKYFISSFICIYQYLSISINIYQYLSISINFYQNLSISIDTISIKIYQHLLIYINIYQYLSISINIYHYLSISINIY